MIQRLGPVLAGFVLGACGSESPVCPEGTVPVEGACVAEDAGGLDANVEPDDASASDAAPVADGCTARTFYRDRDHDGWGDAADSVEGCAGPDGYVDDGRDCDDDCDSCYPGGTEACDEADNDCDGRVDEGVETTFYRDADGDDYGDPGSTVTGCVVPAGYVDDGRDCDDDCAFCRPGGTEICDGRNNDCDASVDEGATTTYYPDCDGDEYAASTATSRQACAEPPPSSGCSGGWTTRAPVDAASTDCHDGNPDARPGADYQPGAIPGVAGAARYDWDCDGTPEQRWSDAYYCTTACMGAGWVDTVPGCGASGPWRECGYTEGRCGYLFNGTRSQECR